MQQQEQSDIKQRSRYKVPKHYKVIMYNDDETTFDFVKTVLLQIFHKSDEEAEALTLTIHTKGEAVIAVYTYDIARTKVEQTKMFAKENGFPLQLAYQPE